MCRANPKARRQMWRSLAQVKHDGNPPRSCGRVAMQCGQMVSKAVGLSQLMKPSKHQSEDKITDGLRFVCPGCLFPHHYSPTRIITWMNIWMHGAATSTMVACTEISNHSRPTCAVYQHFHSFSHFVSCQFRVWPFFLQRMEVWRWKSLEQHPMYVHVFSCFLVSEWATVRRSLACTQYVLRYLTRFRVYRQADYRIGNLSRSVESITSLCPHWSWTFPGEGVCWSRWVNAFQNIGWTCIPSTARWSVYE